VYTKATGGVGIEEVDDVEKSLWDGGFHICIVA
jgi:hypothetical protein